LRKVAAPSRATDVWEDRRAGRGVSGKGRRRGGRDTTGADVGSHGEERFKEIFGWPSRGLRASSTTPLTRPISLIWVVETKKKLQQTPQMLASYFSLPLPILVGPLIDYPIFFFPCFFSAWLFFAPSERN